MTPHIVTLSDFFTANSIWGLGMIAGLFLGVGALVAVMLTR